MHGFRLTLKAKQREALNRMLNFAQQGGDLGTFKRVSAIFAFSDGISAKDIGPVLSVSGESLRLWLKAFLLRGIRGLKAAKRPGRPCKLTKTQKRELTKIIEEGPAEAGFNGNCWRSPMIQHFVYEKFGVFYSVHYISQLLKNMGFSYQKARFVSDHLDEEARRKWTFETWPDILALAKKRNAYLLFGDEASFPQWGTLSYTWARRGQQPTIKTSGKRKGYKVFGLIDYFTGRFFYKAQEERLNSTTYAAFLQEVISKTRKHIILVQDGAPYHKSAAMKNFFAKHSNRITAFKLPSYSPDFNPIEKLWKKIKEDGIHLQHFPTFQDLKDKVDETLLDFKDAATEVLALFGLYTKSKQTA